MLILLTTLLSPIVLLASYGHVQERVRASTACCCSSCRAAWWACSPPLTWSLFYVFFEMSLIPLYLILGIYGGARRLYAAFKFVVFTMAGSLFLLLAILYLVQLGPARRTTPSVLGLALGPARGALCCSPPSPWPSP